MNPNHTPWDIKKAPEPLLWTARQVAASLGISTRHLERMNYRGGPPRVHIGRLIRYKPEDVRAWIESQKEKRP